MKVFCFDLLPYGEELDHLKEAGSKELPWPLPKRHFKPEVAARTYEEHLQVWEEMDRLGYDGVGFNEHHTSPYGLMNSPNLMAAAAAQRTKNLKLLIYGNLLPVHDPLRLAEELAMLDCMSNGRLISGFARGIPREHEVYGVAQTESRDRFEEASRHMSRSTRELPTGSVWSLPSNRTSNSRKRTGETSSGSTSSSLLSAASSRSVSRPLASSRPSRSTFQSFFRGAWGHSSTERFTSAGPWTRATGG